MRAGCTRWLLLLLAALAGCSGGHALPPLGGSSGHGVFDRATSACEVSGDGIVWYRVNAGTFAPIDVQTERCSASALQSVAGPPIPSWAKPGGATQTIFTAASLQEQYVPGGMEALEQTAAAHHIPVTWMIGSSAYLATPAQIALYGTYHADNGDDVQSEPQMQSAVAAAFPWSVPAVSVQVGGNGHPERDPAAEMTGGAGAFWGIAWNSMGTDGIRDAGTPWGAYCADPASYKRPSPDGSCVLVGLEWTARDLTRTYLSGKDAAFSTDPDDLQQRAGFSVAGAEQYVAEIADAYAAAGSSQPLVVISQQESAEAQNPGDLTILDALYARAAADGMKMETLAQAAAAARSFAAKPRAVAFPFIAGGLSVQSPLLGASLYPATIDYHDDTAGMTFVAGQTVPSRVYRYADYPVSQNALPLPAVPQSQLPQLTAAALSGGSLTLHFVAPVALHYGVAIWSDPAALGLSGSGVVPAGHAGAVLVFDLQSGANDVRFTCSHCTSTTFPYAD